MPAGKQGSPSGLARAFVIYLREQMANRKWTLDVVADRMGKSKNYVAIRLREESIFTVQDFEKVAIALDLEPQEMLARIQFPAAANYDGRLVPLYGVVGDRDGLTIYRAVDADPPARVGGGEVIEGRFGVGGHAEDERAAAKQKSRDRGEDPEST